MRGSTTLKTVFGISLFANLMWLADSSTRMFSAISSMPSSIATMLTGLGGLGMIAWQTNRGFKNLIRSQVHRSRIERRAREHQATLDQRKRDAEKLEQKLIIAALIQAELSMISSSVKLFMISDQNNRAIAQDYFRKYPNQVFKMSLVSTPVYDNKMFDIGILGSSLCIDIHRAYEIVEANASVKDGVYGTNYDQAVTLRETIFNASLPFIAHAIARLDALQTGRPDPGDYFYAAAIALPANDPSRV